MAAPMSMRILVKCNSKLSWGHVKRILNFQRLNVKLYSTEPETSDISNTAFHDFPEFHTEDRRVCFTDGEQFQKLMLKPNQPENAKTLKVAIIGDPNVGKSTLTNRLLKHKILPVSRKANTTRKNTLLVYTEDEYQIEFVDTPGILEPRAKERHHVPSSMAISPDKAASEVDLLGVVVDVKDKFRRNTLSKTVIKILHLHRDVPSILILNKVDAVVNKTVILNSIASLTNKRLGQQKIPVQKYKKTHELISEKQQENFIDSVIANYKTKSGANRSPTESEGDSSVGMVGEGQGTEEGAGKESEHDQWRKYLQRLQKCPDSTVENTGWSNFQDIFIVSALKDDGVDALRDYILSCAKPGNWDYHSSVITCESPNTLAENIVWEKMMDFVKFPVYELEPKITELQWNGNIYWLEIKMDIKCPNKFVQAEVVKEMASIAEEAKAELRSLFKFNVHLKLRVLVKK
ncbi:GTPase Era, mitochondrial-like [Crassostrea virginica]